MATSSDVPFPFVEDNRRRYRPGLVVSDGVLSGPFDRVWVVMITGAGHEPWGDDIEVGPPHADFGLPIPSRIRVAKIAAIAARQPVMVGRMDTGIVQDVIARIDRIMGRAAHEASDMQHRVRE